MDKLPKVKQPSGEWREDIPSKNVKIWGIIIVLAWISMFLVVCAKYFFNCTIFN